MPSGAFPTRFFHQPVEEKLTDKVSEKIYEELQGYSAEFFDGEPGTEEQINLSVVMPPVRHQGRFVKGILWSRGMDYLIEKFPRIPQLFNTLADSHWCSYPWSTRADGYLTGYANPQREKWFKKKFKKLADKALIPLSGWADYMHEYEVAPVPLEDRSEDRDIDLLCVSRLVSYKNLGLIAEALKIYREKYPEPEIRMTWVVGKDFDYTLTALTPEEMAEFKKVEEILIHSSDYINIVPRAKDTRELSQYYSRAKAVVLGSLLEGKSRCLQEAISCNTPVIYFSDYNSVLRGDTPALPEGTGVHAPFGAEPLADAIHTVLNNRVAYKPRQRLLETGGRKAFLNQCVDHLHYYESNLPEFVPGRHFQNMWLDLAVFDNYHVSLRDFLYDARSHLSKAQGLHNVQQILNPYFQQFPK